MMPRFSAAVAAVIALIDAWLVEGRQLLRGKPDDCTKMGLSVESKIACYGAASFEAREHESSVMLAKEETQYGRLLSNHTVSDGRIQLSLDNDPEIIFVKSNNWGSAQIRADEAAFILQSFASASAASMQCKEYRHRFCDSQPHNIKTVVHVKFVCSCPSSQSTPQTARFMGAVGASHIYDPIDVFENTGGFVLNLQSGQIGIPSCAHEEKVGDCFSAYLVANDEVKKYAEAVDINAKVYIVQHHHNNFHHRQRAPVQDKTVLVGVGGLQGPELAASLEYEFANAEVNIKFRAVEDMVSEGCPPDRMLQPSPTADCYASKFETLTLGIAWVQRNVKAKSLDDSAQRLVNMLAVGVPTIGHSVYASYREALSEAVEDVELLQTANSIETLKERLLPLALDFQTYQRASQAALAVADLYSPAVMANRYKEVFSQV